MKKLFGMLLMALVLGVSGTTFAANGLADVPQKHWSYAAVKKLVDLGLIEGYDNKSFNGDRILTRYEMALLIDKAMDNSAKADEKTVALINKLALEYTEQLEDLGARMTNLEQVVLKNTKGESPVVNWGGSLTTSRQWKGSQHPGRRTPLTAFGIGGNMPITEDKNWAIDFGFGVTRQEYDNGNYKDYVNDRWDANGVVTHQKKWLSHINGASTYITARKFADGNLTVGNFKNIIGDSFVSKAGILGFAYGFGNPSVKYTFSAGTSDSKRVVNLAFSHAFVGTTQAASSVAANNTGNADDDTNTTITVAKPATISMSGSIMHVQNDNAGYAPRNYGLITLGTGLKSGHGLTVDYAHSDAVSDNIGYMISLAYGAGAGIGSHTWAIRYGHSEKYALFHTGFNFKTNAGWEYDYRYQIAKNIGIYGYYMRYRGIGSTVSSQDIYVIVSVGF